MEVKVTLEGLSRLDNSVILWDSKGPSLLLSPSAHNKCFIRAQQSNPECPQALPCVCVTVSDGRAPKNSVPPELPVLGCGAKPSELGAVAVGSPVSPDFHGHGNRKSQPSAAAGIPQLCSRAGQRLSGAFSSSSNSCLLICCWTNA